MTNECEGCGEELFMFGSSVAHPIYPSWRNAKLCSSCLLRVPEPVEDTDCDTDDEELFDFDDGGHPYLDEATFCYRYKKGCCSIRFYQLDDEYASYLNE